MAALTPADLLTWAVIALATAGVILRPFRVPEAIWAVAGAVILVALRLLPPAAAWRGVVKGLDIYLFLAGMMLLAEIAREEGLFDWLAGLAVRAARGAPGRLFALIYLVGIIVTTFLSNDATAVVLTPAVAAAARAAKARPLPYLLICAFIANAASFVLPISNPANLVVYADHMPPLRLWLLHFGLASILAIFVTFLTLRWTQRRHLRDAIADDVGHATLSFGGKTAAFGIVVTAIGLIIASALAIRLGLPACIAGLLTTALVLAVKRTSPLPIIKNISWAILPLVAGLFVFVEALETTGALEALARVLKEAANHSAVAAAWSAGLITAFGCNLVNNLPAGLLAGAAVHAAKTSDKIASAVLIGIDLGPNLSVTGSLATILWLTAIRREGENVSALTFLRFGLIVMPPALIAALAGMIYVRW